MTYAAPGRLAKYSPPAIVGVTADNSFAYDADGRITHVTRGSQTIDVSYDDAGRPATIIMPTGAIGYAYDDQTGNLASVTGPGGVGLSLAFDGSLLTQQTWTGPVSGAVANAYDSNFFLVERSINDTTINYQYDPDGLLIQAGMLTITRDQTGLPTTTAIDNIADTFGYDSLGQESSYGATVNGSTLYSVQLTRDAGGRLTGKTETIQGVATSYSYTYDSAGQLSTVATNSGVTVSYSYDANGNRVSYTGTNSLRGQYDAQDRQTNYGTLAYTYRDDGQLVSSTDGQATTNYQYDAFGNLLGVSLPDGTQIDYLVDGTGRRVGKKVNGLITRGWLYQDRLRPAAELDGSNNVVSTFVYASPYGAPSYMTKNGTTYRIISDERGSPRLVIDTLVGTVVQRLDYDEFGQVVQDSNPGFQPFGFGGGLYDPDTALVRFGARDYVPWTGRWSGKDLLLFAGAQTNLYAYAANDPVNRIDPTGFDCLKPGVEIPIYPHPVTSEQKVGVNLNVSGTEFELEIDIGTYKLPIPIPTFADPNGLPFQIFQEVSKQNLGPWSALVDFTLFKVLSKFSWVNPEFAGLISAVNALGPAAAGFGVALGEGAEKVVLRHHPECAKDLMCDVNPFGGHSF